ncbi:MAG: type 1 fimbrial protein [Hafnia sp.]
MNLNKTLLAAVITLSTISMANAADEGHGKITFTGSIVDSPCSISPDSNEQTVELGQISNAALQDGGKSKPRNFDIKLENCAFGDPVAKNKVSVTFTGMESVAGNGLLGISGTAKGASVAITQANGEMIVLGQPTTERTVTNGNNTLSFAAYVQGDGASSTITEGEFQSVADFNLAYN